MVGRRKPPGSRQDNRPSRQRGPTPEVRDPLGNAPDHLDDAERGAWQQIAKGAPPGVLTSADRLAVEMAARLWAEMQRDPVAFPTTRLGQLQKLLGSFGMTPAARLALALPLSQEPQRDNPFAALDRPQTWDDFPDNPRRQ